MRRSVVTLQYSNAQKWLVVLAQLNGLVDMFAIRLLYLAPSAR